MWGKKFYGVVYLTQTPARESCQFLVTETGERLHTNDLRCQLPDTGACASGVPSAAAAFPGYHSGGSARQP